MKKIAKQTINGKAFEYAIFCKLLHRLSTLTNVISVQSAAMKIAAECYSLISVTEKQLFDIGASTAVNTLIDLEPKLAHGIDANDVLELDIVSDSEGQSGDVRDVIAIRSRQKWEIGVSAKNNHKAVKHSRLSKDLDFGRKWLGKHCSNTYFEEIKPFFEQLKKYKKDSTSTKTWKSLGSYQDSYYVPILKAFCKELQRLYIESPQEVASNLVSYLIGNKDFYKVIKKRKSVEIEAYNLHGTLNQSQGSNKSIYSIKQLKLPSQIFHIDIMPQSKNTISVVLNEGWQISFRIHNASSRVEPSLKFDINLISAPNNMFKHTLTLQ